MQWMRLRVNISQKIGASENLKGVFEPSWLFHKSIVILTSLADSEMQDFILRDAVHGQAELLEGKVGVARFSYLLD